jgi:hypothetical protein
LNAASESKDFGGGAENSTRGACAPRNQQSRWPKSLEQFVGNDDVAVGGKRKLNFSNFRFGVSAVAV